MGRMYAILWDLRALRQVPGAWTILIRKVCPYYGHGEVMAEDTSSETPKDPSVSRRLLTLKEVSDMLRAHPNSIRRWSDTGLLPAMRIGERGDLRFRLQDVERFLQGHLPESRTQPLRSGKSPRKRT